MLRPKREQSLATPRRALANGDFALDIFIIIFIVQVWTTPSALLREKLEPMENRDCTQTQIKRIREMEKMMLDCFETSKFLRQEQGPRSMGNIPTSLEMNSISVNVQAAAAHNSGDQARASTSPLFQLQRTAKERKGYKLQNPKPIEQTTGLTGHPMTDPRCNINYKHFLVDPPTLHFRGFGDQNCRKMNRLPEHIQAAPFHVSDIVNVAPIAAGQVRTFNKNNGSKLLELKKGSPTEHLTVDQMREKILSSYQHSLNCRSRAGECGKSRKMKHLLEHMKNRGDAACACVTPKGWIDHFRSCSSSSIMCQPLLPDVATLLGQSTSKSIEKTGKLARSHNLAINKSPIDPLIQARNGVKHQGLNTSSNISTSSSIQVPSILKRKLFNTPGVPNPKFKRVRLADNAEQLVQLANKHLNDGIRPIADEKLCMDFSEESTRRFRKSCGSQMAAMDKRSCVKNNQVMNPELDEGSRAAMDGRSCLENDRVMNPVINVGASSSHSHRRSPSYISAGVSPPAVDEVRVSTGGQHTASPAAEVSNSILSQPHSQEHFNDARLLNMQNDQMEIVLFDVVKDPGGPEDQIRKKSGLLCAETAKKLCAVVNVQNITASSANSDQIAAAFNDLVASNQVLDDNANFNQHGTLSVIELVNLEEENFGGRELSAQMEKKLSMDIFQSKENEDFNQMNADLNRLQFSAKKNSGTSQAEMTVCETNGKVKILEEKTSTEREELLEMKVPTETDKIEMVMDSNIIDPLAAQNHKQQGENGVSLVYSFSAEQVREHILSLKHRHNQSEMDDSDHRNCCSLCGLGEITFNAPKRFAAPTVKKVKNSGSYETWVECDKCCNWQHQICALFNVKMNKDENVAYTCPDCYLSDIESGKNETFTEGYSFEAKKLPTTNLSDHIEQWLVKRLGEDRQERANLLGKNVSEVPGVEDLVIRVVSSVNKKVKVTNSLRDKCLKDNYPEEFPYKSKVILLFQKIGGADVCIFVAYVQEYGSQCPYPNRGRVYISYIDSVNYFRPRISAATGESLRTYVYQEILIGYLDYCKSKGFTNCHIWVSPSRKNDDYILYSHPKEQKMPKPAMLQKWYQDLIVKAQNKNIVVRCTNLYDEYSEVAAENLPCFDGDFWHSAAVESLNKEVGWAERKNKRKPVANSILELLRDDICRKKDTFIIIDLQHSKNCKVLPLHDECYEREDMSSQIFDRREDFLEFCIQNHCEFSSLRRAKYSTMMIIHHLFEGGSLPA